MATTTTITLNKDLKSNSHNAPAYNEELGGYYPKGTQFKLYGKAGQRRLKDFYRLSNDKIVAQQIGGEETPIAITKEQLSEYFGLEVK